MIENPGKGNIDLIILLISWGLIMLIWLIFYKKLNKLTTEHEVKILIFITIIGGVIRFWNLGYNPLWVDEALYGFWVRDNNLVQEYPTIFISHLFNFSTEFELRFLYALAGTLTIPAIYLVVKNYKLESAVVVAFFPLFAFWSRMARPYAFAGLFLVLGWRYWYLSLIAIATTPLSLIGIRITRKRLWIPAAGILIAVGLYFLRPDFARDWTIIQFSHSTRWWYLIILTAILYLTQINWGTYLAPWGKKIAALCFIALIGFFITTDLNLQCTKWYSHEVVFSDWRNKGPFDYTTNVVCSHWYCPEDTSKYFRKENTEEVFNRIKNGDTLRIGVDYYALFDISIQLQPAFLYKYASELKEGKVLKVKLNKNFLPKY